MKNFKELGSKKKKFLISAGGILVITLIVILAATGLPKDGDSKADKVIQGNQDIQSSDEAQTDDENKNAAEAAADDGKDGNGSAETGGQIPSAQSGSSGTGSGTSGGQNNQSASQSPSHRHVWADHVATVTVEDEPARSEKVTEYKMYWWDQKKWTTTEDAAVFRQWEREKITWMKEYKYENNMPPELFIGYDGNGNPQYTNDHSIITYYKTVPAVTHEEKKVDYQYCTICGARKD